MTASKKDDLGSAEVQKKVDKETEQGFAGVKVDPVPNEAYTLVTGPESPAHVPDQHTRAGQHTITEESK